MWVTCRRLEDGLQVGTQSETPLSSFSFKICLYVNVYVWYYRSALFTAFTLFPFLTLPLLSMKSLTSLIHRDFSVVNSPLNLCYYAVSRTSSYVVSLFPDTFPGLRSHSNLTGVLGFFPCYRLRHTYSHPTLLSSSIPVPSPVIGSTFRRFRFRFPNLKRRLSFGTRQTSSPHFIPLPIKIW